MFFAPQAKGMAALGKEMDLRRDARIIKRPRIDGAVADFVNGVVPRLKQECRRRLLCGVYAGIQSVAAFGATQMTGIKRNGKVRATACFVSRIDCLVSRLDGTLLIQSPLVCSSRRRFTVIVIPLYQTFSTRQVAMLSECFAIRKQPNV
jgi:hypothetical protein